MASQRKEINEYIRNLDYDRNEVLVYKGRELESRVKKEGHLDETTKTFIVIKREKKTAFNNKSDIGVTESNNHRTFPGSLLLANNRLVDNAPDIMAIDQAPLKYTIDLPGMTDDGSFTIVPTYANYQSALNKVLKIWYDKYEKDHAVNVRYESDQSMVYSKEQLRVKLGMEFKNSSIEANIDFSAADKNEKFVMVHKIKQIFFTVSVETKNEPAELFGSGVTRQDLEKICNNENPPVIVDSVSYGRMIYVVIETSSTDKEAKAILEGQITFTGKIGNENDYTKVLKDFSMHVYLMGGSSENIQLINAKTVDEVNQHLIKHSKFGAENPGYPLSYASQFLKDNSRALINTTTNYTETTRTEFKKGVIHIKHTGWFWAKVWITYDSIRYDENGEKICERKGWNENGNELSSTYNADAVLPGNSRNIQIYVTGKFKLPFSEYIVLLDQHDIPLISERSVLIYGVAERQCHLEPNVYSMLAAYLEHLNARGLPVL